MDIQIPIGAIVIAVLTLFKQSGATDSRCTADNGLIADQSRCTSFHICILGEVRRSVSCSEGLMFDANMGKCNHRDKVDCGTRGVKTIDEPTPCPSRGDITITLVAENTQIEPFFNIRTSVTAPMQSLRNFLLMAAGQDERFRFQTRQIEDFGEFVSSINGLGSDPVNLTAWVPFTYTTGPVNEGIESVKPTDGLVYLFKFYSFLDGCTDDECQAISRQFLS